MCRSPDAWQHSLTGQALAATPRFLLPPNGAFCLLGVHLVRLRRYRRNVPLPHTATYRDISRQLAGQLMAGSTNSVSTPPRSAGCRNAIDAPMDPCRGRWSSGRMSVAPIDASAAVISATAYPT